MTLTMSEAHGLTCIIDAAQNRRPVARALSDGTVVYGTASIISDDEGGRPTNNADLREQYGRLHLWPIAELIPETFHGRFLTGVTAPKPEVEVGSWRAAGPAEDPTAGQVSCHLEAWAVETTDVQTAALGDLDSLHAAVGGDGPFRTIRIGERDYVVVMTPHCQ